MKLSLNRRYSFPASHRLFRSEWTQEQNSQIFGKCANPHSHGHNYTIEVAVCGPVNSATGMIANLADLDRFVQEKVIKDFDHVYLNEQVPEFHDCVPTTENLCHVIFHRLSDFPHARLVRLRIEETAKNSFEYSADEHE
jgi:6-pyruvoyltetrahydropterin/6-carboxytetrahydropterin synthase